MYEWRTRRNQPGIKPILPLYLDITAKFASVRYNTDHRNRPCCFDLQLQAF